jgi:uncharacterized tellurite resistance protein B-like protein
MAVSLVGISDWLHTLTSRRPAAEADTETVRRIMAGLDELDQKRARYLAAFSYILSRVAGADREISEIETRKMVEILQTVGQLPEAQAMLVVGIARHQNLLFGGTEDFLVTREFRSLASAEERQILLDCLFAVSAADQVIRPDEDAAIWQIAGELGFSHEEFVHTRLKYSDLRSVLRKPETPR